MVSDLKIVLIYGPNLIDSIKKDGDVEKILKEKDDVPHFYYMRDFLKEHFLDDSRLQSLVNSGFNTNSIFIRLYELGHIVFVENTSVINSNSGLIYLPKNISKNQSQSLIKFCHQLQEENYNITVFHDLYRDKDGIINGKQSIGTIDKLGYLLLQDEFER